MEQPPRHAVSDIAILSLAFAGGALEATVYLGVAHVFTGAMTGNTVLLFTSLARGLDVAALRSFVALVGFCVGVATGVLALPKTRHNWLHEARRALMLETLLLCGLLIAWASFGPTHIRYELLVTAGLALGVQSAVARSSDVHGVYTTYITGTLTTAIARLMGRLRKAPASADGPGPPGMAWITYGAGALAGAVAVLAWHDGAVAIPLAVVMAVSAGAWVARQPALVRPEAG